MLGDESNVEEDPEADDEAHGGVDDFPDIGVLHAEGVHSPVDILQERQTKQKRKYTHHDDISASKIGWH